MFKQFQIKAFIFVFYFEKKAIMCYGNDIAICVVYCVKMIHLKCELNFMAQFLMISFQT